MASDWRWLESTRQLQTETYGYDLFELSLGSRFGASPERVAALAKHLEWNLLAAYQELGEVGIEFSWKPWAVDKPFVNRRRVIDEVVDQMHFLGNILVSMGVSDVEFEGAYRQKQDKNRRRQASGTYSAQKGGLGEGSDSE